MNKNITSFIFALALVAVPAVSLAVDASPAPSPVAVQETAPAQTSASSAAPSTGSSSSSAAPSTGSSGSSASPAAPSTGSSSSSAGSPVSTPAPAAGDQNGNSSSSGSNVSGSGSYIGLSNAGYPVYSSSCPLLNETVMERGLANDPVQVTKLQSFLKDTQELDVDVTGIYDQKTEDAVKAFQTEYMSTIMGPWGATQPSGIVYITTVKQINELACKQPLTLNASELAVIQSYRSSALASSGSTSPDNAVIGSSGVSSSTATATLDIASGDQTDNTASVGTLSIFQRFWDFIISLFR